MSFGLYVAIINLLICSIISYSIAPIVIRIGYKFNIVDLPDFRKVHKKPIVRIGGLTIFGVASIYFLLIKFFTKFGNFDGDISSKFYFFLIGGLLFFLIGIHDDIYKSSPFFRLILQFVVAFFVSFGGIRFCSLDFYLPYFGQINILLPNTINYLFSMFWIVGITNAINWLDGIDALAGGYCAILCIGFCSLMLNVGNISGILFFSIILGSIIGFLIRNFKPALYIMGDCGSNFLGYLFSSSSLLFLPELTKSSNSINIFYLLLIFSLPLGDMFLVITERLLKKQNIFLPDRNHIHHKLMNLNIGYNFIISLLLFFSALTISIGFFNL